MVETPAAGGAVIVALGEHVDYRDDLGWRDRLSSAAFTARRAIATAAPRPHGNMTVDIRGSAETRWRASVRALNLPQRPDQHADVFLAIIEDHLRSEVTRGENRGRTPLHTAVDADVALAPATSHQGALRAVAFIQERKTGVVPAAASAAVPGR